MEETWGRGFKSTMEKRSTGVQGANKMKDI